MKPRTYIETKCQCGQVFLAGRKDVVACEDCRYQQKRLYVKYNGKIKRDAVKGPKTCSACKRQFTEGPINRLYCDACRRSGHGKVETVEGRSGRKKRQPATVTSAQLTLDWEQEQMRRQLIAEARERGEKLPIRELDRITGVVWK